MNLISIKWSSLLLLMMAANTCFSHGTMVSPPSRVYRIYQSNVENPNFQLARNAIQMDTKNAYYTWNQVSRNISQAVQAGLPPGFDYSPWAPDGQIASGGRTDPNVFGQLTYSGLDQVSSDWPTMEVQGGESMQLDFIATAVHEPSIWDFWITTPDWNPNTALNWDQMEFMGRQNPVLQGGHYYFDFEIPSDRSGHHVLWVAWHRNDPAGEVFFSASDIDIIGSSEPCEETLELAIIDKSIYQAAQSITCSATIASPTALSLIAGNHITLQPSFDLEIGASLSLLIDTEIETCGNSNSAIPGQNNASTILSQDRSESPYKEDQLLKMAYAILLRGSPW